MINMKPLFNWMPACAGMTSFIKLLLFTTISIISLLILGSDFLSLTQIKNEEKTLEKIQMEKEKMLTNKIKTSSQQAQIKQFVLLDRSVACFTLVNFCETTHVLLTKIQIEKAKKKTTQNTFEISLELMSDYYALISLMNELNKLPWKIDLKSLSMVQKKFKKTKRLEQYPLEIKLKLTIPNYYLPTKDITTDHFTHKISCGNSPFLMKRCVGKLTDHGQTFDIISLGTTHRLEKMTNPLK